MNYRHTQVGYVMITSLVIVSVLLLYSLLLNPETGRPIGLALLILIICGWFFSSLTTEINDGQLRFWFGPGLFKKTINLSEVASCQTVKNSWWYGWGMHLTPHGWLYNVSGFAAVEIKLKNSQSLRLGSDEPEALGAAIKTNLR
jgi:hypothetical protein